MNTDGDEWMGATSLGWKLAATWYKLIHAEDCRWQSLIMKNESKRLIREQNPTSSRIAFVVDDGYFVYIAFFPRSIPSLPPIRDMELSDRVSAVKSHLSESTVLYRRPSPRPFDWARSTLRGENPSSMAHVPNAAACDEPELVEVMAKMAESIKSLSLSEEPDIKLIWSDSGESVAAVLNGEPWAFIDGNTGQAYSKGVLGRHFGNPWDEELFKKVSFESAS